MNIEKCVCCHDDLKIIDSTKYERDEEGGLWCVPCYLTESDIGE